MGDGTEKRHTVISIYHATRPMPLFNVAFFLVGLLGLRAEPSEKRATTGAMTTPEKAGPWGVGAGIDCFLQPVERLPIFADAVGENTPDLGSTRSHGMPCLEGESDSSAMAEIRLTADVGFGRRRKGHDDQPADSEESTGCLNHPRSSWMDKKELHGTVMEAWTQSNHFGSGVHALCNRLQEVSNQLRRWSFDTFGSVQKEIKRLKTQLAEAKVQALVSNSVSEVRDLERQLHELYEREEVMFRQRSRQEWLKAGDRNTRFFQNRASHRRRKNTVRFLKRDDGSRCDTDLGMREIAQGFYRNLYSSEGSANMDRILDRIQNVVS